MASTRAEVAGVTGPNTPATPGCTRSHSDLLPLKLSSVGYLGQGDQTSVTLESLTQPLFLTLLACLDNLTV